MLIWASVVGSIYSNFLIFYSNFSESENYHRAYYTAISALERGELVVKQRQPWYEWYGGWQINKNTWNVDNKWSYNQPPNSNPDYRIGSNFSYLSDSWKPSTIFRTINSRASQIPAEWKWDVEWMLSYYNSTNTGENSNNYNMMDYNDAELFLLYYDNVNNSSPYNKITISQCTDSAPAEINWKIRLPKLLSNKWFWNLDTNHASIWQSNELPPNDAIIDRQVRWLTKSDRVQYTIYSTQSTAWSRIFLDDDTAIREADINNTLTFSFSNNRDIIRNSWTHWNRNPVTIISQKESVIKNYGEFKNVFRNTNTTQNQVRFSILNLLKSVNNKIYPFLEYQITFKDNSWNPVVIPDKYYTINAEWNFSDYQINIVVQKPTAKESVLRNFTSIF